MKLGRKSRTYDAFLSYSHDDIKIAAAVQKGLHRVGRRMGQLRALRVYRDATDLAANPGFWAKLNEAISDSHYLVAIASPHAASSEWVNKEISTWVEEHGSDKILIVLATGTLVWDEGPCRFDPVQSTSAPAALSKPGVFEQEPLYVDLTELHADDLKDLGPGVFRSRIVDLAAPIHGKSKDELESEDRTELKRFRRYRRFAIGALLVLFTISVITSIFAVVKRNEAIDQAANAKARELAAISITENDPDRALALAVEAEYATAEPVALARAAYAAATQRQSRLPAKADGPGLAGHDKSVSSVSWSADGKRIVSIATDGSLIIWDVEQRSILQKLDAKSDAEFEYLAVAWSPDNRLIAASTVDDKVALWDTENSVWLESLHLTDERITALAWSTDAQWLAIGSFSGSVRTWEQSSGEVTLLVDYSTQDTLSGYRNDLAWAPDGSKLLSSGIEDGIALILDPLGEEDPFEMETGTIIRAVDWSPDGLNVAIAGIDSTITVLDSETGEVLLKKNLDSDWVDSIAYSPDGQIIASGDRASELRLFYSDTGKEVGERLTSHSGWVVDVVWSPDGNSIATSSTDFTVRTWLLSTPPDNLLIMSEVANITTLAWSPDSTKVVGGYGNGELAIWNTESQSLLIELDGYDHYVYSTSWSADGARIATSGDDGWIVIWDAITGDELIATDLKQEWEQDQPREINWSPDSVLLASAAFDGSVKIWNADTGLLHGTLKPARASAATTTALSWSPTGSHIVAGDEQGGISIWNTTNMLFERELVEEGYDHPQINAISWSPDGSLIASGYEDSAIRIWNAENGELRSELQGHNARVSAVSWSPDSNMLATASNDATVRIWELNSDLVVGILQHPDWKADVSAVAWSPDGNHIASAFMRQSIQLWSGVSETDACWSALKALGAVSMLTLTEEGSSPPRCSEPASISNFPTLPVISKAKIRNVAAIEN